MTKKIFSLRFYLLFAGLVFGGFTWASYNGIRLLGDDLDYYESSPTGKSTYRGGHSSGFRSSSFHHK